MKMLPTTTARLTASALALGALGLAVAVLPGCNIAGPAFYFIHGPEKVPRAYALDDKKPTVIFIDDRSNRLPRRALRTAIAQQVETTLLKQKAIKDAISHESAVLAAGNDRYDKPMTVAEIGRAVRAEVVIYATIDSFTLSPDGQTYSPVATLRVKVVDASNDARLWPADPRGHAVTVRPHVRAAQVPANTASRYEAEDELAALAGLDIARLFFKHEAPRGAKLPD